MSDAIRTTVVGYVFAAVLIGVGWGGPIGDVGVALAIMLALLNALSFVVLAGFAWMEARRLGPDDPELHLSTPRRERCAVVLAYGLGGVVAAGLLVVSFLVFVQTGGFAP